MPLPEIHDLFVFLPIVPFSFGSKNQQESQLRKPDKTLEVSASLPFLILICLSRGIPRRMDFLLLMYSCAVTFLPLYHSLA